MKIQYKIVYELTIYVPIVKIIYCDFLYIYVFFCTGVCAVIFLYLNRIFVYVPIYLSFPYLLLPNSGTPAVIEVDIMVRSMGPISEVDMVIEI